MSSKREMSKLHMKNKQKINHFKDAAMSVINIVENTSCAQSLENKIVLSESERFDVTKNCQNSATSQETNASIYKNNSENQNCIDFIDNQNQKYSQNTKGDHDLCSATCSSTEGAATSKQEHRRNDIVAVMYRLHQERENAIEEIKRNLNQPLRDQLQRLASVDIVCIQTLMTLAKRLNVIRNLNTHLKKIIMEVSQLKQKLRKPIYQNVWDVHFHHQKYIVDFFEVAGMLIKDLEKNFETFQWNCTQDANQALDMEPLLTALRSVIMLLEKNIDSLAEFRINFTDAFVSC